MVIEMVATTEPGITNGSAVIVVLHCGGGRRADNPNNYTFVAAPAAAPAEEFFNCEVLACPEWSDLGDLVNDTRFDYYTMYASPARKLLPRARVMCNVSAGAHCLWELL